MHAPGRHVEVTLLFHLVAGTGLAILKNMGTGENKRCFAPFVRMGRKMESG